MIESRIASEAREAAAGARRQVTEAGGALAELARRLRAKPPAFVMTCARGSSDHAATYGKYVIETTVGHVVASVGPSVASLYKRAPVGPRSPAFASSLHLGLDQALFLAVSQSGRSPDLLELTEAARRGGALVAGMINDETSPLASLCDVVIPLCAGEERAIAATKSFLLAGLGFLQLAAAWTGAPELRDAVARAADALDAASAIDWQPALARLATAHSLYVLGRGVGLGAALEIALKLKETCRVHAEAFSTAEVLHGPIALVDRGFPVLALGQHDETADGTRDVLARLVGLGATVSSVLDVEGTERLPAAANIPAILEPLCQVQSFYFALPSLARARGLDADAPSHLHKVTKTV